MKKLRPLQIYLIGCGIGLLSGMIIRPFSGTAHTIISILAIGIVVYGIAKHFRGR